MNIEKTRALSQLFNIDFNDLTNKILDENKDLYTAISDLTNIPREDVKSLSHAIMYSFIGD